MLYQLSFSESSSFCLSNDFLLGFLFMGNIREIELVIIR